MRRASVRVVAAASVAAALTACAQPAHEAQLNLSGSPPAFQQGYAEGCASASARNARRDEVRYRADAEYMKGWNNGYSVCRRR